MRFFPVALALCASSALAALTEKANIIGKVRTFALPQPISSSSDSEPGDHHRD
jgi:hypothetical protein